MKKGRGFLTIGLFALAATLLSFSVVGSSRAALTYFSDAYVAEVRMLDIGVTLEENGESVSSRDYAGADDEWITTQGSLVYGMKPFTPGKTYDEALSVYNSGTIDEYVRVTVYKYWVDANTDSEGYVSSDRQFTSKRTDLDPSLIDLHFTNCGDGAEPWYIDEASSTPERTVLYYKDILPSGGRTEPFTDTLTIKDGQDGVSARVKSVTQSTDEAGNTVIETTYDYDGLTFIVQADVDAVQTHNAPEAIMSAWGVEMGDMSMAIEG